MVTVTMANPKTSCIHVSLIHPQHCASVSNRQNLFIKVGTLLQATGYYPVMFMGKAEEPTARSGSGCLGSFKNQQD